MYSYTELINLNYRIRFVLYNFVKVQMPHYPDEIEYSDKYMDDYYEYRHVILPKEVYKKLPRGRLLTESVCHLIFRSGDRSGFNNLEDGCTMNSINLNLISFSLGGRREAILRQDYHHLDSLPLLMPSFIESDFNHLIFCNYSSP